MNPSSLIAAMTATGGTNRPGMRGIDHGGGGGGGFGGMGGGPSRAPRVGRSPAVRVGKSLGPIVKGNPIGTANHPKHGKVLIMNRSGKSQVTYSIPHPKTGKPTGNAETTMARSLKNIRYYPKKTGYGTEHDIKWVD